VFQTGQIRPRKNAIVQVEGSRGGGNHAYETELIREARDCFCPFRDVRNDTTYSVDQPEHTHQEQEIPEQVAIVSPIAASGTLFQLNFRATTAASAGGIDAPRIHLPGE
jgi:hypothetical protein